MTFKHLLTIILLVLCLGFSPVQAQDPNPVVAFLDAAIAFGDTLGNVDGFNQEAYTNAITQIRTAAGESLPTTATGYDNYFTTVQNTWDAMTANFTSSTVSETDKARIKGEYTNAMANFIKSDCTAIVNSWAADPDHVAGYYANLNTMYAPQLTPPTVTNPADYDKQSHVFNHLDAGAPAPGSKGPVRVNIDSAGIYDKWIDYNIRDMVTALQGKFSTHQQLQDDLNWFLSVWPQASEVDITTVQSNGSTVHLANSNIYGDCGSGREIMSVSKNYTLNEYGQDSDSDMPDVLHQYQVVDQVYLDRQYGYDNTKKTGYAYTGSSSAHYFNTVSVQVGDRVYQLYDALSISPIVLDLDGDGRLEASKGEYLPHPFNGARLVEFDINGDEFPELTEWVGSNDGILLQYNNERDLNANAFFGEAGGFSDGYEKLSLLDANNDKQLAGEELKTLSVWQDHNTNGKVDTGEISSVTALGISAISLAHQDLISSFTQNGTSKKMWDWYPVAFRVKRTK